MRRICSSTCRSSGSPSSSTLNSRSIRWWSSRTGRRWLRWGRRGCSCRSPSRAVLARSAAECRRPHRLECRPVVAVPAARRRGVPRGRARPPRGQHGRHRAGGLQRGQRGVRRRLPRRAIRFTDIVDTVARVLDRHLAGDAQEVCRAGTGSDSPDLDVAGVLRADRWARGEARRVLGLSEEQL